MIDDIFCLISFSFLHSCPIWTAHNKLQKFGTPDCKLLIDRYSKENMKKMFQGGKLISEQIYEVEKQMQFDTKIHMQKTNSSREKNQEMCKIKEVSQIRLKSSGNLQKIEIQSISKCENVENMSYLGSRIVDVNGN